MTTAPVPGRKLKLNRKTLLAIVVGTCLVIPVAMALLEGAVPLLDVATPLLRVVPRSYLMEGPSMEPNLGVDDRLITLWRSPQVGDVVVVRSPQDDVLIVKRVIAVGPATVEIDEQGHVSVNGARLRRVEGCPGIDWQAAADGELSTCYLETLGDRAVPILDAAEIDGSMPATRVPAGSYFVMGDNRMRSNDSRNPAVGNIPEDRIMGVVQ